MKATRDRRELIRILALLVVLFRLGFVFRFFAGQRGAYVADAFRGHLILDYWSVGPDPIVLLHGIRSLFYFLL